MSATITAGSPAAPHTQSPASSIPCSVSVSDVGVALGMQIMSNVTTNWREDAAATSWLIPVQLGSLQNFLERAEAGNGLCQPDLRHCDLLRNPFSVIGCRRKQSHISHSYSLIPRMPFSIVLLAASRPQVVARVGIELSRLRVFGQLQ